MKRRVALAAIACASVPFFNAESDSDFERRQVPPLPAGVVELKFSEFFELPIGNAGVVYTEKIRALNGSKVRIRGYMVRQHVASPGLFLLTPTAQQLHEDEYGLCDDLPATTLHVVMPNTQPVPFTPGPLLLTGTLRVGTREEADGRISTVRLELDPPQAAQRPAKENFIAAPVNSGAATTDQANQEQKG